MKKLAQWVLIAAVIAGCSNDGTNTTEDTDQDTVPDEEVVRLDNIEDDEAYPEWEHDEVFKMMIGYFGDAITFMPYPVDSAYIQSATDKDSLPQEYVQALIHNLSKHELNGSIGWILKDYYLIDSLKRAGGISEYRQKLDIGQTQECSAHALNRAILNDSLEVFIWALSYSSYEACPYYAGTLVLGTFLLDGESQDCFLLGEYMGAGDPPAGMTRQITSLINGDDNIELHYYEESTDNMDDPRATQKTVTNYKLKLVDGKVLVN